MPAIPPNDTAVIDEPWDAQAQIDKIKTPVTEAVGDGEFAWKASADADQKADFKFPHHQVDQDGKPGAANVNGVRNGLARLSQADIPSGDEGGVRDHLQHHLDAFNRSKGDDSNSTSSASVLAPIGALGLEEARTAAVHAFARTPLAIEDKAVPALIELAARQLATGATGQPLAVARRGTPAPVTRGDGTQLAIIPLHGTITPEGSLFSMLFGLGGGLQAFRASFREALADDNVSAILIDVNSPGGIVDLVPETAAEIRAARGQGKPIVAIANTLAASAGYWIASQADELIVTPSGMVGSVGVFTIHEDLSRMADMMGITVTMIAAGDHKIDGNAFQPLSKAARASLQDMVDQIYASFTMDVAAGRGVPVAAVTAGYGQGRVVLAKDALALKMVDRVEPLEATLARLGGVPDEEAGSEDVTEDMGDSTDLDDEAAAVAPAPAAAAAPAAASPPPAADAPPDYLSARPGQLNTSAPRRSGRTQDPGSTPDYLNGEASEQPAWAL